MKQTLKIGMLAAAAVLMVLTGCKNGLTPTKPSDLSFEMNADDYRAAGEPVLVVTNITNEGKFANSATHRIKVSFSMPVTKKSVEAVTIQPLSNPTTSGEAPTLGTAITPVKTDVSGADLYFDVPTEGVKMLYVYVKAAGVKSLGGAVMNQDMDSTSGETKQDDYAKILNRIDDTTTLTTGSDNYLNMAGNSIISYGSLAQFTFSSTLTEGKDAGLVNKVTVCFKQAGTNLDFNAMYGVTGEQIGEVLKKHLTFEQFNPETKAFVQVKVTYNSYDSANKEWSAALEGLTSNRTLRAKWVDIKTIKEFETKYPSVVLVFMKHDANLVDTFAPRNSVTSTGGQSALWPEITALTLNVENGKATLTLLPVYSTGSSLSPVMFKVWADNKYQNVTLKHSEKAYQSFKGFDRATLKKENFKLFYTPVVTKSPDWYPQAQSLSVNLSYYNYSTNNTLKYDFICPDTYVFDWCYTLSNEENEVNFTDIHSMSSDVTPYPDAANELSFFYSVSIAKLSEESRLNDVTDNFSRWLDSNMSGYLKYKEYIMNACLQKSMQLDLIRSNSGDCYTEDIDILKYANWLRQNRPNYISGLEQKVNDHVNNRIRAIRNKHNRDKGYQYVPVFTKFYISKDVKTAGCTGYYTKDNKEVSVDVPAFSFGEPVVSYDPYEKDGWKMVSVSN